jgi:hypothetical protein
MAAESGGLNMASSRQKLLVSAAFFFYASILERLGFRKDGCLSVAPSPRHILGSIRGHSLSVQ